MDKEGLVRSDIEVEGVVMNALRTAGIPVTLCVWNFVPQLNEYQLAIATPLFDSKGPRAANAEVLQALLRSGVYQDVPVRKLLVISPNDPVARALERDAKMSTEGSLHIVRADYKHPTLGNPYSVMFAPYTHSGGAMVSKTIIGDGELRKFLLSRVHVVPHVVEEAISNLRNESNASITHVQLTNRDARRLGLI